MLLMTGVKNILCYTDDSYRRMWPDVRYVKVNLHAIVDHMTLICYIFPLLSF